MAPAGGPALEAARNQKKLKHVVLGNMIWDSLTSNFQIELMAEESNFKQEDNFDGALLWHQIISQVNPSIKVAIRNLKDELERFFNQYNKIVRKVGKEGYTEYLHSLFCTYKTSNDEAFLNAINDKETKWVTVDLPAQYDYKDLLDFALKLYTNTKAASKWEGSAKDQKKPTNNDAKFLVMMTNKEQLKKGMEMTCINPTPKIKNREAEKGPRF
eukprot:535265-Ditylum_brightwellii.AAC.1